MARRGVAKQPQYRSLKWNPGTVRDALLPFKEVAMSLKGNERTVYTSAGGVQIGRSKDDPERKWIDSYSAIKTAVVNAVFVCYVKSPGDEPDFQLQVGGTLAGSYNADQLSEALVEWRAIAARAEK